ncbi:hypothetical protein TRAPUB_5504 [Trametes pubescens]|uniref:Uncharacterized protein n=1 Tax=Trametes pubescens TaxID=154538 RepID=A0A1M2W773_TRAPU|nr:hypothetical protein TRAPUB_5504 [Trametes pubescens]
MGGPIRPRSDKGSSHVRIFFVVSNHKLYLQLVPLSLSRDTALDFERSHDRLGYFFSHHPRFSVWEGQEMEVDGVANPERIQGGILVPHPAQFSF